MFLMMSNESIPTAAVYVNEEEEARFVRFVPVPCGGPSLSHLSQCPFHISRILRLRPSEVEVPVLSSRAPSTTPDDVVSEPSPLRSAGVHQPTLHNTANNCRRSRLLHSILDLSILLQCRVCM